MYEVTVKTGFSAAHQLRYYDGKYENLHGHNWIAIVTVETKELDKIGLGVDFVALKKNVVDIRLLTFRVVFPYKFRAITFSIFLL